MTKPTILVSGASGKTGGAVAHELLRQGWPVRALVRTQDARTERLARAGADVAVADLFDPEQLTAAMHGTARAYFVPPFHPFMLQSAAAFAAAAQDAHLELIVGMSQWLASPAHPSLLTRQHWLADRLFSNLPDVAYTCLKPTFFADNYLRLIDFAAHFGVLPNLTGDSRNAPPSTEDIARVAAAALTNPDAHAGKTYCPTGPALLSVPDMARILSRVLGRTVQAQATPIAMFLMVARAQGVSTFEMSSFRYYVQDHKRGAFEHAAPLPDVRDVTGQPPEEFETIARRYAALPKARRDAAGTLRALGGFLRVGVTPPPNLTQFERQYPKPPRPTLASDSARWRQERSEQPSTIKSIS